MDFIKNLIPFSTMKLPKLRKLRQWSHDQVTNLSQLTNRTNSNANPKLSAKSTSEETKMPVNGISTISAAIREQRIDPKKDNFGLYALKCDRSQSMANARRGILLNLPTTKVKARPDLPTERTHEVFQPVEKISEIPFETKIQPPPRRKKRPTATRQILAQPKPPKKPILRQANQNFLKTETLEKNDSGLYRIVNPPGEVARVSIEETSKKCEHVVTMVKPKVQKAIAVKSKPVQQQVAKVKSYEWSKHQRKASLGNVNKPMNFSTKRYVASESSCGSFKSENSVDIFQSNKLLDQKKLFDEFDELFDKSKSENVSVDHPEPSPETAFSKLRALKSSSSSFSTESGLEVGKSSKTRDFLNETPKSPSSKPKIVHEQPKAIIKKKILYYDDESEFKHLIMNQTQATTIINNHFTATVLPPESRASLDLVPTTSDEGSVPISSHSTLVDATGKFDLNGNEKDYRRPFNARAAESGNSNSLRIFSNEGIFVFNL